MDADWNWYWGVGTQAECYHLVGSKEEAIETATEYAQDQGYEEMTICEGKPWTLHDSFFDADRTLEEWHEQNEEAQAEDGELGMNPDAAQKRELENALNEAFAAWRAKHNLGRAWALDIRNKETITIPYAFAS
jgi:hypothetical protein